MQPDPMFPGELAPGEGGTWYYPRDKGTGSNLWMTERSGVLAVILDGQPRKMLASEIESKLRRGREGKLTYGAGIEHDVEKMASTDDVLELRLTRQLIEGGGSLHTRIYFNEPAARPGEMLLLCIATKTPDAPGKQQQNRHAALAETRLDSCHFEELPVAP